MLNEILLNTLGDALRRMARKIEEAEERIKAYREVRQREHERLQSAEQRKHRAEEQREKIAQEMEVLRTFMGSQREQSHALMEQFDILQQQQRNMMSELYLATDHVQSMRAEYQHATGQLAGAEQEQRDAQREWDKISEQITRISLQGLMTVSL